MIDVVDVDDEEDDDGDDKTIILSPTLQTRKTLTRHSRSFFEKQKTNSQCC